ncbi:hypothetical protein [Paraclostridium sordellii]|nr:hypothetical protein [Paeniclostridium sordellii]
MIYITVKDKTQNKFKNPTPEEFFVMLKSIGFVEFTSTYENLPIERNLDKPNQLYKE